ncbi:MAG: S8 family peptidase [Planctomycetes bacterium]|nr:S8 family peptidase [Planctomycetota bacterium]
MLFTRLLLGVMLLMLPARGVERVAASLSRPARYLVVLRDGTPQLALIAHEIAVRTGGRIVYVYEHAVRGFAIEGVRPEVTARLARDPRVRWIEADVAVRLSQDQESPPWGLDRVDQRDLPLNQIYQYGATGTAVRAYILDTGVRVTHAEFGGRASDGYDFVDDDPTAEDGHGHGTHVAGIVGGATYGVAKEVEIVAVRVLDNEGAGTIAGVVAGVDWVTAHAIHPAVANMSLGGLASTTLDEAVRTSIASGVTYCVAAGNGTVVGVIGIPIIGLPMDASLFSPARVSEALTVGATDIDDSEAWFSNYGAAVDILAPGVDITSAWNGSDTASVALSGTSMATPHVTGAVALHLERYPSDSPSEVASAITGKATPGRITGMSSPFTPNLLLYTRFDSASAVPACGLLGIEGFLVVLLLVICRRTMAWVRG